MSFNNYTLANSKPLINREQNYVLDRKLLTVHSEDRDVTKWPQANQFEIMLPEQLLNVQSMRLIQATIPGKFATFSNDYQNTKLWFSINQVEYEIKIQEGYYTPEQLTIELTNKMNAAIGFDSSFNVFYDEVAQKLWFGHTDASFNLDFCKQSAYDNKLCEQPIVWHNNAKWGLPYYLGFEKKCYESMFKPSGISFDYICPNNSSLVDASDSNIIYYYEAPLSFNITGETCIYLEVDKYNSYDELYPYNQSSTNLDTCQSRTSLKTSCIKQKYDNNAYDGKVNSAFAKIPIQSHETNSFDSRTFFLHNLVHYDPPIERIARLKFKLRFHDGRLVNFQNYPFDFTIEFNSLRNEIEKKYNVRIPAMFIL